MTEDLVYDCPNCGSQECKLDHQDVLLGVEVILCWDCDQEHTVEAGTNILSD